MAGSRVWVQGGYLELLWRRQEMVRVGPLVSIWAAGLSVALGNQRLHSWRTGGGTLISTVGGLWDPFPQPWLCTEKALKTSEEAPGQKQTIGLEAAGDPGAVCPSGWS